MLKCVLTLSAEFVEAAKYGVTKLLSVTTRVTHITGVALPKISMGGLYSYVRTMETT
jgi:hypothetical protein